MYIVCQTPNCQQTYSIDLFKNREVNVSCERCGGVLVDEEGRGNLSQHDAVITGVRKAGTKNQEVKFEASDRNEPVRKLIVKKMVSYCEIVIDGGMQEEIVILNYEDKQRLIEFLGGKTDDGQSI